MKKKGYHNDCCTKKSDRGMKKTRYLMKKSSRGTKIKRYYSMKRRDHCLKKGTKVELLIMTVS